MDMEEITLRECIEIILKRKKMIFMITIFSVIVSAVFSYFIIPEKYEASAILAVSNIVPITDTNIPTTNIVLPNGEQASVEDMMKYLDKSTERETSQPC